MNPDKLSRRELEWLALLVEVGVPLERAEELVGVTLLPPPGLPEGQLPLYLRTSCEERAYLLRSARRGFFRRHGLMGLWAILLTLFAVCRLGTFPAVELFRSMNLSLPLLTRWVLEPNWILLLCPFLVLRFLRNRSERQVEERAREAWAFLGAVAAGHRPEESLRVFRSQHSQGFREVLVSAMLTGRCARKTAQAWVDCLEWDLSWKSWTRRWRWMFLLISGVGVTLLIGTLALCAPVFQLIGCL